MIGNCLRRLFHVVKARIIINAIDAWNRCNPFNNAFCCAAVVDASPFQPPDKLHIVDMDMLLIVLCSQHVQRTVGNPSIALPHGTPVKEPSIHGIRPLPLPTGIIRYMVRDDGHKLLNHLGIIIEIIKNIIAADKMGCIEGALNVRQLDLVSLWDMFHIILCPIPNLSVDGTILGRLLQIRNLLQASHNMGLRAWQIVGRNGDLAAESLRHHSRAELDSYR